MSANVPLEQGGTQAGRLVVGLPASLPTRWQAVPSRKVRRFQRLRGHIPSLPACHPVSRRAPLRREEAFHFFVLNLTVTAHSTSRSPEEITFSTRPAGLPTISYLPPGLSDNLTF